MRKKLLVACLVCCLGAMLQACGTNAYNFIPDLDSVVSLESAIFSVPQKEESTLIEEPTKEEASKEEKSEAWYEANFELMSHKYAFQKLSDMEKYWYVDIYYILINLEDEIELYADAIPVLEVEGIDKIFQCVLNDHPDIFYVVGYNYTKFTQGEETVRIAMTGKYTMDKEEVEIRKLQIQLYVEECLAGIQMDASEYEKVKYIYEYLIANTEYNIEAPDNQNICSVFITRESVCQGYAKANQYLLEMLGVETTLVLGSVETGEGHAWNLVKIDGNYYYVDPTWGDASYQIIEEGEVQDASNLPLINYDYLCVTTKQLCKTHTINNVVPVPECVSMIANYYVMEGTYFTELNEGQLKELFETAYSQGKTDLTLKCADYDVYHAIFEQLITSQKIFRYLNISSGSIAYVDNKDQLSMTFWLTQE